MIDDVKAPGGRIFLGVGGVEAIDIGQQDQLIGPHRHRDLCGQAIIVAKSDLVGGHGVVFIHDGNDTQRQKRCQRGARVQIAAAVFGIFQRHQHLRGLEAVGHQDFLVGAGQADLADRRRCLRLFQRQGSIGQAQHPAPQRDRARGHQNDIGAAGMGGGHILGQTAQPVAAQARHPVDQQRRADLDHQPPGGGNIGA